MSPLWGKGWLSVLILVVPAGAAHSAATQAETSGGHDIGANLGLMRGHLLVAGKRAYRACTAPLKKHPPRRFMGLAQFEVPGFSLELGAFADVLAMGEQGRELFSDGYAQLIADNECIEEIPPLGVRQQQALHLPW